MAFIDYRGMCCARDHKLVQVIAEAMPVAAAVTASPANGHYNPSSSSNGHGNGGHHAHSSSRGAHLGDDLAAAHHHTEVSHATSIVSTGGVAIATPATTTSQALDSQGRIWQHAPGETTRRRHSVGVGRMTGGGLSTLLPNSLVHIMVNRRPPDGNVHAHKTRDLPFNLLSLNGLQIIALRNMNLRALGGIHHVTSLIELDVENNALDSLPIELASCHSLRVILSFPPPVA
jgi:hypothetical protein